MECSLEKEMTGKIYTWHVLIESCHTEDFLVKSCVFFQFKQISYFLVYLISFVDKVIYDMLWVSDIDGNGMMKYFGFR